MVASSGTSSITYIYDITCKSSFGNGITTSDSIQVTYIGFYSCSLTSDYSSIKAGESNGWHVTSSPDNLPYFWDVTGQTTASHIAGEGKTNWNGVYTYNTPGTYNFSVGVEKDGKEVCRSSVSLKVIATSTTSTTNTNTNTNGGGTTGGGPLSCSPASQVANGVGNPYTVSFSASGGNGTYSWTGSGGWTPASGSGSSYTLSGYGKISNGTAVVTSDGKTAQCCFGAGIGADDPDCSEDEEPSPVGDVTATTDMRDICDFFDIDENGDQYCASKRFGVGDWRNPLDAISPLNGVELRFFRQSGLAGTLDSIDFVCNDPQGNSYSGSAQGWDDNYGSYIKYTSPADLCRYTSPGNYIAQATGHTSWTDGGGRHSATYIDTVKINVSAPAMDLSMSAAWNIPKNEASTPSSRYDIKWDYDSNDVMNSVDATLLGQCAGNLKNELCPNGNKQCIAEKTCDFNGVSGLNIGDSLAYSNYLKSPIKIKSGNQASGVISLQSNSGGTVTIGNIPTGFSVSPTTVVIPAGNKVNATITTTKDLATGTYTATFLGTGTGKKTINTNPLSFTVVGANNFIEGTTYSITVTKTTGGTVTSSENPKLINCGSTCVANYANGSSVTLTATPASSYWKFNGWSGSCSGTSSTCVLNVNASKTVTPSFGPRGFNYSEF